MDTEYNNELERRGLAECWYMFADTFGRDHHPSLPHPEHELPVRNRRNRFMGTAENEDRLLSKTESTQRQSDLFVPQHWLSP